MKENGYVGRGVVQSCGKEAEEAEEEEEEVEEGEEEDGQTKGGEGGRGSSWSYCLSGVVARVSADRGDIARREEGDRRGDGGCQRMRGSEGGKGPWRLKERSTAAEEEAKWQKKKEKRRRRRTRRLQRARMEREKEIVGCEGGKTLHEGLEM